MGLSNAEKSELKLRHGDLISLEEREGIFLFKKPDRRVYAQFMAGMTRESKKNDDKLVYFEQLCIGCLVHPEKSPGEPDYDRLTALFERLPGVCLSIGGELSDAAGAGESSKLGKL